MKKNSILTIIITLTILFSCTAIAQQNDNIKALPKANFTVSDSVICASNYVTFTNLSENATLFIWYFEGGNPDSSKLKEPPTVSYEVPGIYNVTLIASNSTGKDTLIKYHYIVVEACNENYVFVPNIFTPNDDGVNDILFVRGPDVVDFHMYIFDRWGKKVHEMHNINEVWNGEINKQKAEQGTYVYYIDVSFKNNEVRRQKGSFALIR